MAEELHGSVLADAAYTLARVHAHGMADGSAAAAADCPECLDYQLMLDVAWEVSCERPGVQPLAEQEEYFVAWVHGYVGQADEMEGAPGSWRAVYQPSGFLGLNTD